MQRKLCVLMLAAFGLPLMAQAPAKTKVDHGMVLSAAMEVSPGILKDTIKLSDTKNYVFRGKVITLNPERTLHLCYDTELMRVAGVWHGSYVNSHSDKNMGPPVEGTMIVASKAGPGWSRRGDWKDPRPAGEGPLPREWARFQGLYLHGAAVVLRFTVGGVDVLETYSGSVQAGLATIDRHITMGPSKEPLELFVPDPVNAAVMRHHGEPKPTSKEAIVHGQKGTILEILPALKGGLRITYLHNLKEPGQIPAAKTDEAPRLLDALPLTKGGPPRWTTEVSTQGERSSDKKSPYVRDALGLPDKNPWGASVRFAGLDFFPDGRAALSTWDGDVWIASGLDDGLESVRWKRFAAGLQHPLGLKIVGNDIYTAGRDQITRLVDLNGDGEADFYENINNEPGLTLQRHEFVMGLETDSKGNFYFGRSGHYIASKMASNCAVYKMSPDGKKLEVFARGFREPNGVCIGPGDLLTLGDNEGNGIPQSPLYHVREGGFYGYTPNPAGSNKEGGTWKPGEKPIVWLPKTVDASSGGQVWAPLGWGPLSGQLLHTSYGNCTLLSLLIDKKAEPWQGAVWKFPITFPSGLMRARFNPADGQLYVCGLRGWGTSGLRDGDFSRIRFTGDQTPIPIGFEVVKNGLQVTFSHPLDRKAAEDDQNWGGHWTTTFTSKREDLPIDSAKLSNDGRTATVQLDSVHPAVNFTLTYRLKSAAGQAVAGDLHGTIHRVPG
jgi:glucose/arabinose dehydrogenase